MCQGELHGRGIDTYLAISSHAGGGYFSKKTHAHAKRRLDVQTIRAESMHSHTLIRIFEGHYVAPQHPHKQHNNTSNYANCPSLMADAFNYAPSYNQAYWRCSIHCGIQYGHGAPMHSSGDSPLDHGQQWSMRPGSSPTNQCNRT
jgi:hypothetical protein